VKEVAGSVPDYEDERFIPTKDIHSHNTTFRVKKFFAVLKVKFMGKIPLLMLVLDSGMSYHLQ
jgi:hypothetical protein